MQYLQTDWAKAMQTNPTANFLLNNGLKVKKFWVYKPISTWNDPKKGRNARWKFGSLNNEEAKVDYTYNYERDELPLSLYGKRGASLGFMTEDEFKKNKAYNIYENSKDKKKNRINKHKKYIGTYIGEERVVDEPVSDFIGIDEKGMEIREHYEFKDPSFWENTIPVSLYNVKNTQLRPNPFASISKSPLQISTPLISFSN